jgi:hypothetical protein
LTAAVVAFDAARIKAWASRRKRRIIVALVIAILAYPVLGTLALWTGFVEWVVRSEDLRVEIDNPAYTIWPGHIHAKRVKILVNGETQFTLEGHNLMTVVRMFPILKRRIHVTHLSANDVRYRMRIQVKDTKGIEERVAAYPPLRELPGVSAVQEKTAEKTEEREESFTVEVEGIDVKVAELWFMEYRYLGDGTLKGEFLVGPQVMRVGTSVQDLGPGELRFGAEQVIAKNFGGRISAEIPELNPEEHANEGFLDFVTAQITLKADVETLKHVSAYVDGVDVKDGKGKFTTDLYLQKGWLGPKSVLAYATDRIGLAGEGFGVKTDWDLKFDVETDAREPKARTSSVSKNPRLEIRSSKAESAGRPRIRSHATSTYVSFAKRQRDEFTVQIHGHSELATLKSTQIGSKAALRSARVDLPDIQTADLDDLDAAFAPGTPFSAQAGTARASLHLDVDENYVAKGPFRLRADGTKFQVAGVNLGTDARLQTELRYDLKRKHTTLEDFRFSLADASMHVGDEDVDGWWMILSTPRATAVGLPPRRYETTLAFRAKDAEPILEALAEKDQLNDLIAKFTSLDDLRAGAKVRGEGEKLDVVIDSESDVWDAAGRYSSDGKRSRLALVIGGKAVSIGIASDGKSTRIVPFARTDWLNRELLAFPKPLEQLKPTKP